MEKFERIYRIHNILSNARVPVPRKTFEGELDCARSTFERLINAMRLYWQAPIEYDRERNGYYYDDQHGEKFELPGLWFNASELHALLAANQLLNSVQPGFLTDHLAPLQKRIDILLNKIKHNADDITRRIRILQMGTRKHNQHLFSNVADALLNRTQIHIRYHDRQKNKHTERTLSPQRLIHYRDNWFVDAWCHLRNDLRTFSVDRVKKLTVLEEKAKEISDRELDAYYADAYGIFSGKAKHLAKLKFTAQAARWVAYEQWHPRQQGQYEIDGSYKLDIPYSDPRELIMDILKYGPDVEIISPPALRKQLKGKIEKMRKVYKLEDTITE